MRVPQGAEWLILLLIVVLLFGAKRLPDAARGLGRSLRIFKAETKALADEGEAPTAVAATPEVTAAPEVTTAAVVPAQQAPAVAPEAEAAAAAPADQPQS